jgi:predicted porin
LAYTLGDLTFFGIYERLKYEADGLTALTDVTQYARNAWSVGGKWNTASGYFGGQFIMAMDGSCEAAGGCDAAESGAWMVGLGYYHTMSRQTQAYVMGTYVQNDDNQFYGIAGASTPLVYPGADTWALTVGLKHSF